MANGKTFEVAEHSRGDLNLEDWFLEHGKPVDVRSDRGPQFRQEFNQWCEAQKINHQLSSAYNHQSNGHAEVAVREMKYLLEKSKT